MALYNQRGDRRCPDCLAFPDVQNSKHWKACVPKRYWPQWVREGAAGPTVAVSEYDLPSTCSVCGGVSSERRGLIAGAWYCEDHIEHGYALKNDPLGEVCDCGYIATNARALAMHKRKAKQHQAVTA